MKTRLRGMLVTATKTGSIEPSDAGIKETRVCDIAWIIFVPVKTPVKMPAAKIIEATKAMLPAHALILSCWSLRFR